MVRLLRRRRWASHCDGGGVRTGVPDPAGEPLKPLDAFAGQSRLAVLLALHDDPASRQTRVDAEVCCRGRGWRLRGVLARKLH